METRFYGFVCVLQVILAYESIVLCKCSGNVLLDLSITVSKGKFLSMRVIVLLGWTMFLRSREFRGCE